MQIREDPGPGTKVRILRNLDFVDFSNLIYFQVIDIFVDDE
jgi:hypothetical protein